MIGLKRRGILLAVVSFVLTGLLIPGWAGAVGGFKVRTYDGGGDDAANGIAVNNRGRSLVVGVTEVDGEGENILLMKLSKSGKTAWKKTFNGPANLDDSGEAVALDGKGNAYVAGYITVPGQGTDVFLRKYSSEGRKRWTQTWNNVETDSNDFAHGLCLGPTGEIYLVGQTASEGNDRNILVQKYLPDGTHDWTRIVDWEGLIDAAYGVAVGPEGNIYVTGYVSNTVDDTDLWLRKYFPGGGHDWTAVVDGGDGYSDAGRAVAVSADGVFVAGRETHEMGGGNFMVARFDSATGGQDWKKVYNGPDDDFDEARGITVGPEGMVYATGFSDVRRERDNVLLMWMNPAGSYQGMAFFNGAGNHDDMGRDVAVSGKGKAFVAGYTVNPNGDEDIWVGKLP